MRGCSTLHNFSCSLASVNHLSSRVWVSPLASTSPQSEHVRPYDAHKRVENQCKPHPRDVSCSRRSPSVYSTMEPDSPGTTLVDDFEPNGLAEASTRRPDHPDLWRSFRRSHLGPFPAHLVKLVASFWDPQTRRKLDVDGYESHFPDLP